MSLNQCRMQNAQLRRLLVFIGFAEKLKLASSLKFFLKFRSLT